MILGGLDEGGMAMTVIPEGLRRMAVTAATRPARYWAWAYLAGLLMNSAFSASSQKA